jgi:hypothetical protein
MRHRRQSNYRAMAGQFFEQKPVIVRQWPVAGRMAKLATEFRNLGFAPTGKGPQQ